MPLKRSFLLVFAPFTLTLTLAVACSSEKKEDEAVCTAVGGGNGGEGRCGNGPNAGTACCVPSHGACAAGLPLCETVCCGLVPPDAGADASSDALPDSSTEGAAPDAQSDASTCPGNTKQKSPIVSAACQAALDAHCCPQLKSCFDITPAAAQLDCNAYSSCVAQCALEKDPQMIAACQSDCAVASSKEVVDAYDALTACATSDPSANAACQ